MINSNDTAEMKVQHKECLMITLRELLHSIINIAVSNFGDYKSLLCRNARDRKRHREPLVLLCAVNRYGLYIILPNINNT